MKHGYRTLKLNLCLFIMFMLFCSIVVVSFANDTKYPTNNLHSNEFANYADSNIGVAFETERYHFDRAQNILVSYLIPTTDEIMEINHFEEGFNVISIEIDSNNINRIYIELSPLTEYSTSSFSATITTSRSRKFTVRLFSINNEYGIFISPFSVDDANTKYEDYALQNGIIFEDIEYEFINGQIYPIQSNEVNNENILPICLNDSVNSTTNEINTNSLTGYINVYGTLNWIDSSGVEHPLRQMKVKIYAKTSVGDVLLATTSSDNAGNYVFSSNGFGPLFENSYLTIFIKIFADDDNVCVKKNLTSVYCSEDSQLSVISLGGSTDSSWTYIPMTVDTNLDGLNSDYGKAFQIYQAIITARDYAQEMIGEMPPDVPVYYPCGNICEYNTDPYDYIGMAIYITGNAAENNYPESYESWDLIMHEYGHHVQTVVDITSNPGVPHDSSKNDADVLQNKDEGIRLAWAESWPTVFGLMAQDYYKDLLTNIDTVNNSWYTAYNGVNYNIENNPICLGEACERSIMSVLWDLFDDANDDIDTITLGHEAFWVVTTGNQSKTFHEFIQYFYDMYPSYIDDIGKNLTYYGMATSRPRMLNSSTLSETTPPIFSWIPQGGSVSFPNNSFVLIFYDEAGNEILRTPRVTATTYTLTQSQWNVVRNSSGDTYSVAVAAKQTDSPITGDYISWKSNSYSKSDIHYHSYTDHCEEYSSTQHKAYCICGEYKAYDHNYTESIITDTSHRLACLCGYIGESENHYTHSYAKNTASNHYVLCECGYILGTGAHVLPAGTATIKFCIHCGQKVTNNSGIGVMPNPQNVPSIRYITDAGSYVDAVGNIYLVDSDMELYLAGELDIDALIDALNNVVTQ